MVLNQKTFIILIFSYIMEIKSQNKYYYFENQKNIRFNDENKQILKFYFNIKNKYISNEYDNIAIILDLERPFFSYISYDDSQNEHNTEITPCKDGDKKYIFRIDSKNKEFYILSIIFNDKYNNRGTLERYPQDFKCDDGNKLKDFLTNVESWIAIIACIIVIALYYNWIICCCKCCGKCKDTRYCCCLCVECSCKSTSSTTVKVHPYKRNSSSNIFDNNLKELERFRENQNKEQMERQKEIEENIKIQKQKEIEEKERQIERVREENEFIKRRELDLQDRVNKGLA